MDFRPEGISHKTEKEPGDPQSPCGLPRAPPGSSFMSLKKENTVISGPIPFDERQKNDSFLRRKKWPRFSYAGILCPATLM